MSEFQRMRQPRRPRSPVFYYYYTDGPALYSTPPPPPRHRKPPLGKGVKWLLLLAMLVLMFICTVPCAIFVNLFFAQYR